MLAFQTPKLAQKDLFLEILAASSAPRPILSFRSLLYIIFDYKWQQLSNIRISDFYEKSWKRPTSRKFFAIFEISKCSNLLKFWGRRNSGSLLDFLDFFQMHNPELRKYHLFCIFIKNFFPKIFRKWKGRFLLMDLLYLLPPNSPLKMWFLLFLKSTPNLTNLTCCGRRILNIRGHFRS